jgi:glycosyltransferase involved in cell wall biosynthesis
MSAALIELSSGSDVPAPEPGDGGVVLSVVTTILNERDSLRQLADELTQELDAIGLPWEVILVDDGSNDGSRELEQQLAQGDPRFRAVHLRRNFGKAAALDTGFRHARGSIVVTMDADLQDDPAQIHVLLAPILDGSADLVSGWKWPRKDPASKRWPSKVYNLFSRLTTGVHLHDMNCGFKAYRAQVVRELALYGDMHRYIPVLAYDAGFAVTERKISHRPRIHGHSKYAAGRFVRGFLDLLTILFITRYRRRPLHLIGSVGIGVGALGLLILGYLSALWLAGYPIGTRPLLTLGVLLVLISGQFFTFGLLAEMMTFHSQRAQNDYPVVARFGFDDDDARHVDITRRPELR